MTISLVIIGLAAVFAVVAWQKIDWAIVLTVLSLPIYQLRFSVFSIPLTFLELEILILFLIFLIQCWRKKKKIKIPVFFWTGILFIVAAAVAIFYSPDMRAGLGVFKAYFVEPYLFFIVLINIVKKPTRIRWIVWALGVLTLFIGIIAVWQYMGLLESFEPWISESPRRVTSVFEYPNAVGLFLAPVIVLLFGLWLLSKNYAKVKKDTIEALIQRRTNGFLLGAVIFGLVGVFCSFTRGAMVGIFLGVVFLGFFSKYKKYILLTIAGLLIISMVIPYSREMFVSVISGQDVSTDVRSVMWQGTYDLLKDRPVLGAGLAGFPEVYDQYRLIKHVELLLYPHNIFLNFWVEIGLFGLIVFIAILVRFFQLGIKAHKKSKDTDSMILKVLPICAMASMLTIISYGLIEAPYFKNDLAVMFWLFLGMMTVTWRATKASGSGR